MHTFLQILEVNLFEKRLINQMVDEALKHELDTQLDNQLKLFNY
jgi:hypothetical protein